MAIGDMWPRVAPF